MTANVQDQNDESLSITRLIPVKSHRGWALQSTDAVRRRLARVLMDLSQGREMSTSEIQRARALIYGFSVIGALLKDSELSDLETRIESLEKAADI